MMENLNNNLSPWNLEGTMGFFEVNSSSPAKKRSLQSHAENRAIFHATLPFLLKIWVVPVELNFVGFSILKKNSFFSQGTKEISFSTVICSPLACFKSIKTDSSLAQLKSLKILKKPPSPIDSCQAPFPILMSLISG